MNPSVPKAELAPSPRQPDPQNDLVDSYEEEEEEEVFPWEIECCSEISIGPNNWRITPRPVSPREEAYHRREEKRMRIRDRINRRLAARFIRKKLRMLQLAEGSSS